MTKSTICIVDDDDAVRDALSALLRTVGYSIALFSSAEDFLNGTGAGIRGCLLLDVKMAGMSGLDLQRELSVRGIDLPIIFLSGHVDVAMAAHAMRAGAIDVIEKPFRATALISRVEEALRLDAAQHKSKKRRENFATRMRELTARELEITDMLVAGQEIKTIARQLGLSPNTVQVHRANILKKTRSESLIELATITREAGRSSE